MGLLHFTDSASARRGSPRAGSGHPLQGAKWQAGGIARGGTSRSAGSAPH